MEEKKQVFTVEELENLSNLIAVIDPNGKVLFKSKDAIEETKKLVLTLSLPDTKNQKEYK